MTIKQFGNAVDRAVSVALDDTVQTARHMSSGGRSSRTLARMDHPYATRHGSPLLPPEIINVQSGEFLASWKAERTPEGGRVINDSPVADFLQFGTKYMVARPIATVLTEELADNAERRINDLLRAFGA